MSRVLVTGATCFIAMHVINEFLKHGHQVAGTVRSLKDATKLASFIKNLNANKNTN